MFKGTQLRSGRVTHIKKKNIENLYFLVTIVFSVSNLFCGALICPLLIWQLVLKLECICCTGKNVTNVFPRSTDIIQVLSELPTDKRHLGTTR